MSETIQGDLVPASNSETAVIIDGFNNSSTGVYSSYKSDNFESKLMLASALTDSEPIAENLGKIIELAHLVIQPVSLTNEKTGEVEVKPRTVMIDKDGKAYSAVSDVLVRRLQDLVAVLGEPHTWPSPVKVRVDRVKGQGANSFFDLQVVTK